MSLSVTCRCCNIQRTIHWVSFYLSQKWLCMLCNSFHNTSAIRHCDNSVNPKSIQISTGTLLGLCVCICWIWKALMFIYSMEVRDCSWSGLDWPLSLVNDHHTHQCLSLPRSPLNFSSHTDIQTRTHPSQLLRIVKSKVHPG